RSAGCANERLDMRPVARSSFRNKRMLLNLPEHQDRAVGHGACRAVIDTIAISEVLPVSGVCGCELHLSYQRCKPAPVPIVGMNRVDGPPAWKPGLAHPRSNRGVRQRRKSRAKRDVAFPGTEGESLVDAGRILIRRRGAGLEMANPSNCSVVRQRTMTW